MQGQLALQVLLLLQMALLVAGCWTQPMQQSLPASLLWSLQSLLLQARAAQAAQTPLRLQQTAPLPPPASLMPQAAAAPVCAPA
jgi:hypothetical protein